jgi:hypothetical protein
MIILKPLIMILQTVYFPSTIYLLWIIIHYFIAVTFVKWCVNDGVMALPIVSDDELCVWLQWIVYNEIGALITLSAAIIISLYNRW